jgi:hypothetical protein
MAKDSSTLKRDGKGYILTITSRTGLETRIKIGPDGSMRDLSGKPIIQSDVTTAVLNLRTIGASGMIENILKWWDRQ